jgi:hypothetical protein
MRTRGWATGVLAALLGATSASANVNLELRPVQPVVTPGQVVEIGLYAVSDSGVDQMVRSAQVILEWDPMYLQLDSVHPCVNNGPYAWLMSGFFNDSGADGLNNTWTDGNAYYQAVGNFVAPAWATPAGLLVTTFRFNALLATPSVQVEMPHAYGTYTHTQVFGDTPGVDVLGTLMAASVEITSLGAWGHLALKLADGPCTFEPGDTFTVLLKVSELNTVINGVQALIAFNEPALSIVAVQPGDGSGSPWDASIVIYESSAGGVLSYAAGLLVGTLQNDAVVARITVLFTPGATPPAGTLELLATAGTLTTRLTHASTGMGLIPTLGGPVGIGMFGDADTDGDVDFADFGLLASCLAGPGVAYSSQTCCRLDFDGEGDIDMVDMAHFQRVFSGP